MTVGEIPGIWVNTEWLDEPRVVWELAKVSFLEVCSSSETIIAFDGWSQLWLLSLSGGKSCGCQGKSYFIHIPTQYYPSHTTFGLLNFWHAKNGMEKGLPSVVGRWLFGLVFVHFAEAWKASMTMPNVIACFIGVERCQKQTEDCSAESEKRYRLWMKMYHPHLEANGDGPSSFQYLFMHTPIKKGQQRTTVAVLAWPHSTIQHMLRCSSPPTSLPSLMPKTSYCVLTSTENFKNVHDKQKMKDEEARLKEDGS